LPIHLGSRVGGSAGPKAKGRDVPGSFTKPSPPLLYPASTRTPSYPSKTQLKQPTTTRSRPCAWRPRRSFSDSQPCVPFLAAAPLPYPFLSRPRTRPLLLDARVRLDSLRERTLSCADLYSSALAPFRFLPLFTCLGFSPALRSRIPPTSPFLPSGILLSMLFAICNRSPPTPDAFRQPPPLVFASGTRLVSCSFNRPLASRRRPPAPKDSTSHLEKRVVTPRPGDEEKFGAIVGKAMASGFKTHLVRFSFFCLTLLPSEKPSLTNLSFVSMQSVKSPVAVACTAPVSPLNEEWDDFLCYRDSYSAFLLSLSPGRLYGVELTFSSASL
jgi:hypothetical protein